MSFYKVKIANFAETVRVGDNGDEIRYINTEDKKHERFKLTYHENMLWIYDTKTLKMYTTSNANLRLLVMDDQPAECKQIQEIKKTK